MKFRNLVRVTFYFFLITTINSCKNEVKSEPTPEITAIDIFNFDDKKQLEIYTSLDLDATHPNMLNPNNSGEDNELAIQTWTDLHQGIANYLADNNFNWNVDQEQITILHKIYFNPDGSIKTYFFRTLTDSISKDTQDMYAKLFGEFAKSNSIKFSRPTPFAQCGKSVYPN